MLLSECLRQAQDRLEAAGVESARLEAQVLAAHVLGKDRTWVLAHPEAIVGEAELEGLLARREKREPISYILGYREFFGRRFFVTPDVLIPRQETETLVETALEDLTTGARILDVGTGSGCLATTIALERPDVDVWASDISLAALKVASRNAEALGARVQFVHSDLFKGLGNEGFDCIVSNPPYVRNDAELAPEVGQWEPKAALFAGEDGLEFYRRLAKESNRSLLPNSVLLVEIGDGMKDAVVEAFEGQGWDLVSSRRDLLGHERVLTFG